MKKIVSVISVLGLVASMPLYAQSKKEIIAAQQNQIQAQQQQLDSLRAANAYLQGYQDQLQQQVSRLDSLYGQLNNRYLQLQHQNDSLSNVAQNLQTQIEQQMAQLQKQKKEQAKQEAAAKKQQEQKKQQKQETQKDFDDMLAKYRAGCAQSEAKLQQFFKEDKHGVNQFSQTKTALLEAYENKCEAGKVSSLNEVKWEVQKTEGKQPIRVDIGFLFENQYSFLIQCPNGRSYNAYDICFQTSICTPYNNYLDRKTRATVPSLPVYAYVPCQEQAQRLMHSGNVGGGSRRR